MSNEHVQKAFRRYLSEADPLADPVVMTFGNLGAAQLVENPVLCYQPYKEQASALEAAGCFAANPFKDSCRTAVMFAQRTREENLGYIGIQASLLSESGKFIFVCPNDLGPKSYEKRIKQLFGNIEVFSKYKVRIASANRTSDFDEALCEELKCLSVPFTVPETTLISYRGNFSWKHVDEGSRLLVEHLPDTLRGIGADFGAGYGYLSHHILSNYANDELHLFEHDIRALNAAEQNCKEHSSKTHYHWCDVRRLTFDKKFDWIVMNPPFHVGNKTDPKLGTRFLEKAIEHLKPGGTLYAVANKSLPYESQLKTWERNYKVTQLKGFKILEVQN